MHSRLLLIPLIGAGILTAQAYDPRPDLGAGHYLKALEAAEAQLKANPRHALALAAKSQALTSFQRFGEGFSAAEQALALQPQLADALLARALARGGLALQQRNLGSLGKASGALDDLRAATRADGSLESAWLSLGLAYQQLPGVLGGSTRKALACAAELRKRNPARGDLLQGMVLAMEERWGEAEPFFGRALATSPADPEVVYGYLDTLGSRETRKALGDAEQRRRLAQEARRLLPPVRTRARAIEAVTDALLDAGAHEEAWQAALAALSQVDAPSLVRLQLGKLSARTGLHRAEGLAYLDQVLKEPLEGGSGGYPAAHWRKAQILKDLGRKDDARAAAREALKLDPKHRGAQKVLEELG